MKPTNYFETFAFADRVCLDVLNDKGNPQAIYGNVELTSDKVPEPLEEGDKAENWLVILPEYSHDDLDIALYRESEILSVEVVNLKSQHEPTYFPDDAMRVIALGIARDAQDQVKNDHDLDADSKAAIVRMRASCLAIVWIRYFRTVSLVWQPSYPFPQFMKDCGLVDIMDWVEAGGVNG